jgi:hypothetical protein
MVMSMAKNERNEDQHGLVLAAISAYYDSFSLSEYREQRLWGLFYESQLSLPCHLDLADKMKPRARSSAG